ncbi:MAG: hypothetical protein IJ693_10000 [Bacteroidaceae bacterium]|nr:hypothetical protein [Bacteroidaceae bacterium]
MKQTLIDKYLNGETSLQEEHTLQHLLQAIPPDNRTDTEDALLLMLTAMPTMDDEDPFATDHTEEYDRIVRQRKHRTLWRYSGIAAAIALIVALGFMLHTQTDDSNIAVAYINGTKVSDQQQVMAMMESTMNDMFAHSNTEEELYEIFNPE